jgi:PAS domain S-box-containing protein
LWLSISVYSTKKKYFAAVFDNITERRQGEEILRENEERLRLLFELAPDAYYISDLKGNFVDGNKAAEALIGYNRDELIGKNYLTLKILSPGQIKKASLLLVKNLMKKSTGPDEFILTRKDGSQVTAEISTHPVRIHDKSLVLGIARDVTERKRTEAELQAARTFLDSVINVIADPVFVKDADRRFVLVNEALCGIVGRLRADLLGRDGDDMFPQEQLRSSGRWMPRC